ncbi:hypothetical protein SAMN05421780_1016 [Flexibacter flexilis DSM 6793]|uniref:Outer membrane lipoprotein-sorting protein n=1 Tax=Flexibacter flexilis DSM 6793 TaxID=927664 RepID=A0A1I1D6T7_9BACT|nr:hypothetical protein [Flexibacter flexilis]SFB70514.1 hypothetical protein SAMN05421780_1016 [Flexibacter flexilis DSM 6793]
MSKIFYGWLVLLVCGLGCVSGQAQAYRLAADFSIKEKQPDGQNVLILGRVYYDKRYLKVVYDISFPQPEIWVTYDTLLYKFDKQGQLKSRYPIPPLSRFSVFHLALTGQLPNYGLDGTVYAIEKTELSAQGMAVTTWQPRTSLRDKLGKILTRQQNKRLTGVVMFDTKGQVLQKQQFEQYGNTPNTSFFPCYIRQVTIDGKGQEFYKISTFKHLVINENAHQDLYNFRLVR